MPPPPSPGHVNRALQPHQTQLEEEIRELKQRNAKLEVEMKNTEPTDGNIEDESRVDELKAEMERIRQEAESLRKQLVASTADASDASRLAEEWQTSHLTVQEDLKRKEKELVALEKEMRLAAERAQGELDAGMEAKTAEVKRLEERAELAEQDGAEMRALVEELTQAGQVGTEHD